MGGKVQQGNSSDFFNTIKLPANGSVVHILFASCVTSLNLTLTIYQIGEIPTLSTFLRWQDEVQLVYSTVELLLNLNLSLNEKKIP